MKERKKKFIHIDNKFLITKLFKKSFNLAFSTPWTKEKIELEKKSYFYLNVTWYWLINKMAMWEHCEKKKFLMFVHVKPLIITSHRII